MGLAIHFYGTIYTKTVIPLKSKKQNEKKINFIKVAYDSYKNGRSFEL